MDQVSGEYSNGFVDVLDDPVLTVGQMQGQSEAPRGNVMEM